MGALCCSLLDQVDTDVFKGGRNKTKTPVSNSGGGSGGGETDTVTSDRNQIWDTSQDQVVSPIVVPMNSSSGMPFSHLYGIGDKLGEGAFSIVQEATHRQTRISYAVKIVTKSKLDNDDQTALHDEIQILQELNHRHIIRLYDVFDECDYFYLIMEKMVGGELFDRIVMKTVYNEKEARDVCKILFEAIAYCHSKKVAHRDLKPENLLLMSKENDSEIKIADFGFAKKAILPNSLTTQCGTPNYVAPEILEGTAYDTQCDMWSLGVIIYILIGGYPPFLARHQRDLFRKIRKGQYEFHDEYWVDISDGCKDLIRGLLTVDPMKRWSAMGALESEWIRNDDGVLSGISLVRNLEELRKFNAKRKFKAAAKAVIAVNKINSLGQDIFI